jgi:hypothetical protein
MARLLMNLVLLRAGYPPLIVLRTKKKVYFDAIHDCQEGDPRPLTCFLHEMLSTSFALYFRNLDIKDKRD